MSRDVMGERPVANMPDRFSVFFSLVTGVEHLRPDACPKENKTHKFERESDQKNNSGFMLVMRNTSAHKGWGLTKL